MTTTSTLPRTQRRKLIAALRERMDEWLRLQYRHDVLSARAVRGIQLEIAALFDAQVARPLLRQIGATLATIKPDRIRSGDLLRDFVPGLEELRRDVERVVASGVAQVRAVTEQRMVEIAKGTVRATERAAVKVAGPEALDNRVAQPQSTIEQAVKSRLWLGDSTEKWFEKMLAGPTADKVRAWVTTGIQQGLRSDEIVRGLVGTRTQTGILESSRNSAEALVRTAATHASAVGRTESFRSLGVEWWRFRATLDTRTSLQCANEDGEIYRVGEGPMPPLHPNCRSVVEPAEGPDDEPTGKRASIDGQVAGDVTFAEWIETLPRARQDQYFGARKAAAWRSGKLSLRDMLGRDMQPLTMRELEALDLLEDDS